jgi:hypothetical protein
MSYMIGVETKGKGREMSREIERGKRPPRAGHPCGSSSRHQIRITWIANRQQTERRSKDREGISSRRRRMRDTSFPSRADCTVPVMSHVTLGVVSEEYPTSFASGSLPMLGGFHVAMDGGSLEVILLSDGLVALSLENVVRDYEVKITGIHL